MKMKLVTTGVTNPFVCQSTLILHVWCMHITYLQLYYFPNPAQQPTKNDFRQVRSEYSKIPMTELWIKYIMHAGLSHSASPTRVEGILIFYTDLPNCHCQTATRLYSNISDKKCIIALFTMTTCAGTDRKNQHHNKETGQHFYRETAFKWIRSVKCTYTTVQASITVHKMLLKKCCVPETFFKIQYIIVWNFATLTGTGRQNNIHLPQTWLMYQNEGNCNMLN